MRVFLWKIIGGTALCSVISFASSTSGSTASGATLTAGSVHIDPAGACNLNEPWLCSEYAYYECHTCTLNNVCIFNQYAFIESGEFHNKMTHHCHNLPFDCNYFHEIKQCRTRYCATQTLCNLDVDGYEICLIKALMCYDEYCEPDLSSLPFDYRLYDLCCHINDIEDGVSRFHNWLVMILGVVAMVILLSLYEIYSAFTKHSVQKISFNLYKKVKYFVKYVIRNYISMKIMRQNIEYGYNEVCKKLKKLKRNMKYHYKNNKMMWCFLNLFDDYFMKMTDANIGSITIPLFHHTWSTAANNNNNNKEQKQPKNGDTTPVSTEEGNNKASTPSHNGNNSNAANSGKKSNKTGNKKKRKLKESHNKKRKKAKTKYKSSSANKKVHHNTSANTKEKPVPLMPQESMECNEEEQDMNDVEEGSDNESMYDDEGKGECKELSDHEVEGEGHEEQEEEEEEENEEEEEEEAEEQAMIEMTSCPACGAMNAEYLSNCDQCKRSMVNKTKKKKKHKKSKQKKKTNHHPNSNKCTADYWQCVQCTYHNQNKYKKCLMCASSKEESKFSTKCTKKSKKKRIEKMHSSHKDRHHKSNHNHHNSHSHHHHHSHQPMHPIHLNHAPKTHSKYHKPPPNPHTNAIVINCSKTSKYVPNPNRKLPHHKPRNSLNPNAKEFILETKPPPHVSNHNIHAMEPPPHHHYNDYIYSPHSSSPACRLSKIPRLQRSVNPEPDYAPRHGGTYHHTRNDYDHVYADETIEAEDASIVHIPPRFQSPPFHHPPPHSIHSIPSPSEESTVLYPAAAAAAVPLTPANLNIALIAPIAPIIAAPPPPPSSELPAMDNAELQRQLSDMEANVHQQLQVLDTLFPAIKPDLSHEIQAMQENMKV